MRSYCICLSLSDYFTWHNALKVHPCCCKWQDFIQFFTTELHSIVSVQFSSVTQSRLTLCDPMDCSTPGLSVHHQLLEPTKTHVHWVSDAIQPSHPLSPSSPAFNLSQHLGLFQWVSSSPQMAKEWSFSFSISPSNEYSGLISFRTNWFALLAVQGILKSIL